MLGVSFYFQNAILILGFRIRLGSCNLSVAELEIGLLSQPSSLLEILLLCLGSCP